MNTANETPASPSGPSTPSNPRSQPRTAGRSKTRVSSGRPRAPRPAKMPEGQQLYTALAQHISEPAFILDVQSMHLLHANPAFLNLLGYTPRDIPSLTIYDLLPYDPDLIDRTTFQVVRDGIYHITDVFYKHKDGSFITVQVVITPVTYNGLPALCQVLRPLSTPATPDAQAEPDTTLPTPHSAFVEAPTPGELRFRKIFEEAPVGIFTLAPLTRTDLPPLAHANRALAQMLGYSHRRLHSLTLADITHPDDVPDTLNLINRLLDRALPSFTVENRYITSTGDTIWANLTATLLSTDLTDPAESASVLRGSPVVVGILTDLTETRRANEQLQRSRDELEVILQGVQDGITVQTIPGHIIYANHAALGLLGYPTLESLLSAPPAEVLSRFEMLDEHGNPFPYDQLPGRLALAGNPASEKLIGWRLPDSGQTRWSLVKAAPVKDPEGTVQMAISIFRDITEQKKAEDALRAANNRFDLAARAVNALIYELDIATGTTYRSPGLFYLTGFHPHEVPSTSDWWYERIHPEDREAALSRTASSLQQGDGYSLEYRVQHKNGRYVHLWDRGIIERDDTGRPVRIVGSTIDITERKELEKRKDDFIALASHELRTPTSTIKGYAQLLARDPALAADERAMRRIKNLDLAADRLAQLVSEMLDVSRLERGQLEPHTQPLDLTALVTETVTEMRVLTNKHTITLHTTPEGQPITVSADPERLRQVLTNLIENAIKYSPNGGTVDVRLWTEDGRAIVSVKDNGIGISSDQISHVFERFYRAPDVSIHNYAGMGLGLSISYDIVKRHSGDMWVESTPGEGSTFAFSLPVNS